MRDHAGLWPAVGFRRLHVFGHAPGMVVMTVGIYRGIEPRLHPGADRLELDPGVEIAAGVNDDQAVAGLPDDGVRETLVKPGALGHLLDAVGRTERVIGPGVGIPLPQGFGQFQNLPHGASFR